MKSTFGARCPVRIHYWCRAFCLIKIRTGPEVANSDNSLRRETDKQSRIFEANDRQTSADIIAKWHKT